MSACISTPSASDKSLRTDLEGLSPRRMFFAYTSETSILAASSEGVRPRSFMRWFKSCVFMVAWLALYIGFCNYNFNNCSGAHG